MTSYRSLALVTDDEIAPPPPPTTTGARPVVSAPLHPSDVPTIDGATHFDVGVAYVELGLPDDAIYELELAAHDATWTVRALQLIGNIQQQRGRWEDAAHAYERALREAAEDADVVGEVRQALAAVREQQTRSASHEPPSSATLPGPRPASVDASEIDRAFDDLLV